MSSTEPLRRVEVIQVVEVVTCCGKGVQDDPIREVITYWSLDGRLLAMRDTWDAAPENHRP